MDKEEVYQSIAVDYTTAELFVMASEPEASRVAFLNNVTMTVPDDASGCIDLDAEKERLSGIWDLAHLSMRELISRTGMSQTALQMRGHPAAHGAELVCRKPGLPGIRSLFVG